MESAVICVICDTQLIDADDKAINCASALPCGHVFHKSCVCQWLELHSNCPICRQPVAKGQLVEKLFFNTGAGDERPAEPIQQSTSSSCQPWWEKYAAELTLGGGVILGAIGGVVAGAILGSHVEKKKRSDEK